MNNKVILKYTLLLMVLAVYNRKYDRTLGSKADVLRSFAKLVSPLEHDKYLEALHCEYIC